ncbi:MAG: Gfo/Idh/MocA family oxidoreductase [Victivallales bacterium]|nr:Gfo/Idh/MocA family oxidoreductase [Victivallales bacterium]
MSNRIIKVGICGLGRIGRFGHIPELGALPQQYQIVAVADSTPDRLLDLPEAARNARTYASLEAMLQDPEVEMVTIATRHPDHVPMALKILAANKIAVVEKPVATSVAEMALLRQTAEAHPHQLFFRHNRRFEPAFHKIRELLQTGLIGEVQYIKLHRSVGFCRRNDWMTMPEFYGGLLTNWGPHLIDQALQLLEAPVKHIWADVRRVISIGAGDDLCKILLSAENGQLAEIELAGCNALPGREVEVIGNRGTLVSENSTDGKIRVRYLEPECARQPLRPHPENPPLAYGNFDEKLAFVDAIYECPKDLPSIWSTYYDEIVNGVPCPVTLAQAAEVVRVTQEVFHVSGFQPSMDK